MSFGLSLAPLADPSRGRYYRQSCSGVGERVHGVVVLATRNPLGGLRALVITPRRRVTVQVCRPASRSSCERAVEMTTSTLLLEMEGLQRGSAFHTVKIRRHLCRSGAEIRREMRCPSWRRQLESVKLPPMTCPFSWNLSTRQRRRSPDRRQRYLRSKESEKKHDRGRRGRATPIEDRHHSRHDNSHNPIPHHSRRGLVKQSAHERRPRTHRRRGLSGLAPCARVAPAEMPLTNVKLEVGFAPPGGAFLFLVAGRYQSSARLTYRVRAPRRGPARRCTPRAAARRRRRRGAG